MENGITLSIRIHTPPPLEPLSHLAIVYEVSWSIWELSIFEFNHDSVMRIILKVLETKSNLRDSILLTKLLLLKYKQL
ncbi:unnamed protein product [Meloidogyne enterolobii]|uniref:Uncharacterized protein n=1 Tax=Meloidogyne enterolobii TaxID=390850 RepID=A0ACB0ZM83_MELEN